MLRKIVWLKRGYTPLKKNSWYGSDVHASYLETHENKVYSLLPEAKTPWTEFEITSIITHYEGKTQKVLISLGLFVLKISKFQIS